MSSIMDSPVARKAYVSPAVVDHGSLAALTADFDVHFVGNVAKLVTMAAVSAPGGGDGGGGQNADPASGGGGAIGPADGAPPPGGDGGGLPPDGGGPDSSGPIDSDRPSGDGDVREERADSPGDRDGRDVRGTGPEALGTLGADVPEEGMVVGAGGAGDSSGGGMLPFTGYAAAMAALIGATLATTGVAIRAKLQRREP